MAYSNKSIKEIVKDIEFNKVYLPAIQRRFVWPKGKICSLFDSIMRNYPIGSFLFWELRKEKANEYVFYEFLKNYDERDPYNKRKTGSFLYESITGVLDGQQRLSSLYLGLQGTYKEKLKNYKRKSNHAYPETALYLNLLKLPYTETQGSIDYNREFNFEFCFLTDEQAQQTHRIIDNHKEYVYWFKVGQILKWNDDPDIEDIYEKLIGSIKDSDFIENFYKSKRFIKKALGNLHKRLNDDTLINFFNIKSDDLEDILEIFIRVNSGGTILSKTDLLFSTIIATWENGRDEIESFLKSLNNKGEKFNFNNDFLMRCCLVLSDLPVLFKVNSFKTENVHLIRVNWNKIKEALGKTVDVLVEIGFNQELLLSQNSIIVIAYFFIKGGPISNLNFDNIKKYLLYAHLKNIYGGQGDQVLTSLRNVLREKDEATTTYCLKSNIFPLEEFLSTELPANKTLRINEEDIDKFLNYKKGITSFFVLALLYPNLRHSEVYFHQDHIHPDSGFMIERLKKIGLEDALINKWTEIKDTLPNLQLMEGTKNESKNNKPFKDWIMGMDKNGEKPVKDVIKFLSENIIPENIDLDILNFSDFYDQRRELMKTKLKVLLNLPTEYLSV